MNSGADTDGVSFFVYREYIHDGEYTHGEYNMNSIYVSSYASEEKVWFSQG